MIEHLWEEHGLIRWHHGVVSLKEIAESDLKVQADPRFDEIHYLIDDFLDCSNVTDIDMELVDELAAIAAVAVRFPARFRHAVVAGSPLVRKLADDFASAGFISYPVRKFDRMTDARAWAEETRFEVGRDMTAPVQPVIHRQRG